MSNDKTETEIVEIESVEASASPDEVVKDLKLNQEQTKAVAEVPQNKAPLKLGDDMAFKPTTFEEFYRMCDMMHRSKFLPARFESTAQIMTAIQYAVELGLKPMTGLRQIAVIKGTPSIFGDLPLSLVLRSGLLISIKEEYFLKDGTPCTESHKDMFGCRCTVKRKGFDEPWVGEFTLDMARKAGLYPDKEGKPWNNYTHRMLKYRPRSAVLKDAFGDVLNGIAIAEYDFNELPSNDGQTSNAKSERVSVDISQMIPQQQSPVAPQ